MIAQLRGDRKGSLGHASAASVGILYIILAAGHANTALCLCFGHGATRVMQILRSHNLILEHEKLRGNLQVSEPSSRPLAIPEFVYRITWSFNRLSTDLRLPTMLHKLPVTPTPLGLSKGGQWVL